LFAERNIKQGEPICFFHGEWVHSQVWPGARRHLAIMGGEGRWFFDLRDDAKTWTSDARFGLEYLTHEKQLANYVNNAHGAVDRGAPNAEFRLLLTHTMAMEGLPAHLSQDDPLGKLPLVGVYATEEIKKNKEILVTYGNNKDYGEMAGIQRLSCGQHPSPESAEGEKETGEDDGEGLGL
jgi:hypothetical protein